MFKNSQLQQIAAKQMGNRRVVVQGQLCKGGASAAARAVPMGRTGLQLGLGGLQVTDPKGSKQGGCSQSTGRDCEARPHLALFQ